ncbi:MAG TPA: PQQ-dependent sugar dehydrogenase, partial [Methylomirabilota bacterium]
MNGTVKTPASAVGVLLLAVIAAGAAEGQLRTRPFVSRLSAPVAIVQDPTDPTVQFVVEQRGRIRVVKNGGLLDTDFLDLRNAVAPDGGERGLFSIAFPPDAPASGRFFVCFTNPEGNIVVARFKRSANPLVADPGSRFDLVWPDREDGEHPFIPHPGASNHNGGDLVFGPDGFLYIGTGDGGGGNDTFRNGQNPGSLLGKMLRIDVNVPDGDPRGYLVPADNPFVSGVLPGTTTPVLTEIWAFGLRNPWRYNFDDVAHGGTGALVIGDVGQNAWEEIDYEPPLAGGRNYGWPTFEGTHSNPNAPTPLTYGPPTSPVFEYSHNSASASITGGYVYRGTALGAELYGRYFFAEFIRGHVWSLGLVIDPITGEAHATDLRDHTAELGGAGVLGNISSFGVDADGELFVISYSGGSVLRIVPRGPADLVVSSVTVPATGVSGRTIQVGNKVRNIGDQTAAGPFRVDIYLSADSDVPGAGTLMGSRT